MDIEKIKQLKQMILTIASQFFDGNHWYEFSMSAHPITGEFVIYRDDLPAFRDLKAFLNTLTSLSSLLEPTNSKRAMVYKAISTPVNLLILRRNFNLFMATDSQFSHFLDAAKAFAYTLLTSSVTKLIESVYTLCTKENVMLAVDYGIEKVILLENYQQKYIYSQHLKAKGYIQQEEPVANKEGLFSFLVRKNDEYLRWFYKEEFPLIFQAKKADGGAEAPSSEEKSFYPEFPTDTLTIKHIKKLTNGVIGIKTVFDIHAKIDFKGLGLFQSLKNAGSFIGFLKSSYDFFQEFDYEAIIADQSNPLAIYIKNKLKELNPLLEKLACLLDQIEGESGLRDGVLLSFFAPILNPYNELTTALRIPIDYLSQKNHFYTARMKVRAEGLKDIEDQLAQLDMLIPYEKSPLCEIPEAIIKSLQAFIQKYNDSICMDRNHLEKYKKYLENINPEENEIMRQLEYAGNYSNMTIHSEIIQHFKDRRLYLRKQMDFLGERLQKALSETKENPYRYFSKKTLTAENIHLTLCETLQKHNHHLYQKNRAFAEEAFPEQKGADKKIRVEPPIKVENRMSFNTTEHGAMRRFHHFIQNKQMQKFHDELSLAKENANLSPESYQLIHEIDELTQIFGVKAEEMPREAPKI